jgi:MbtH protein
MRVYLLIRDQSRLYSIWPTHREAPDGWTDTGRHGSLDECMAYVRDEWAKDRSREKLHGTDGQIHH